MTTSPSALARIKRWQVVNGERVRAARRRYRAKQRQKARHPKRLAKLAARDAKLRRLIARNHYTGSFPSGASWLFTYEGAIVAFSVPANANVARWLLGSSNGLVLELSRLWAPDGHRPNLLTQALAHALRELRLIEPDVEAVISFADPNAAGKNGEGHHGGVYRAASWVYLGRSAETRAYRCDATGTVKPRRHFHSGRKALTKAEIAAKGYEEMTRPGKHRFAKGLTRKARRVIDAKRALLNRLSAVVSNPKI